MNKKGVEFTLITIIKILAVLLVGGLAASKAVQFAEKETIVKVNIAEDIKAMVDVLVGVPGDAVVKYPGESSSLIVILRSDAVSVFKRGDPDHLHIVRGLVLPTEYTTSGVAEEESPLCLKKIGENIELAGCADEP